MQSYVTYLTLSKFFNNHSDTWILVLTSWIPASENFLITSYQPAILQDKINEMYFWIKSIKRQRFTSRLFKNDSPYYSYETLTLLWIACIYYGKYINGKMTRYYFLCKIRWVFPLNSVRPKSEIWPKLSNSAIFGL